MSEITNILSLIRRRWLAVLVACAIGFGLLPLVSLFIPAYSAQAQLLVVSEAQKDTTDSDPNLPSIVTSTAVFERVIHRLKLNTDAIALGKKIKTKLPPKSSILELTYKDSSRDRAVSVVNAVADESVTYYHDIALHGYLQVLSALKAKIADSRASIAVADKRLQSVSAQDAFTSSEKAPDDLTSQIYLLEAQRGQIASAVAADNALASSLQQQLTSITPIVHGEILQKDVVYQQLQQELARDVADLVSERSSFRDNFPGLQALTRRVAREQQQVKLVATEAITNGMGLSPSFTQTFLEAEKAVAQATADTQRLRATDLQLVDEKQHLKDVAQSSSLASTLRAERDANVSQYVTLTQRLGTAEADAAQAASLGTLVVVSRGIPGKSSLPMWLVAFALVVIAASIGIAYLVELLDRRLWGTIEIERTYGRPVFFEMEGSR